MCALFAVFWTNGPSTYFPILMIEGGLRGTRNFVLAMLYRNRSAHTNHLLQNAWQSNGKCLALDKISSLVLISLRVKWKMRCTLYTYCWNTNKKATESSCFRNYGAKRFYIKWMKLNIFRKDALYACTHVVSSCSICISLMVCQCTMFDKNGTVYCHNRNYRNVHHIKCRISYRICVRRTLQTNTRKLYIEYIGWKSNGGRILWAVLNWKIFWIHSLNL